MPFRRVGKESTAITLGSSVEVFDIGTKDASAGTRGAKARMKFEESETDEEPRQDRGERKGSEEKLQSDNEFERTSC